VSVVSISGSVPKWGGQLLGKLGLLIYQYFELLLFLGRCPKLNQYLGKEMKSKKMTSKTKETKPSKFEHIKSRKTRATNGLGYLVRGI
jgi:hypothetical protein